MLYYEKPYLKREKFKVLEREENKILLNDTILYPGGGGQPPDEGFAVCKNGKFKIRHLGDLWHELDGSCEGEEIEIILNWERRFLLMSSHTAEHTFFRFLENMGAVLGKINLREESSIVFTGEIDIEDILKAEQATRELIHEGRDVSTFWIKREDVKNYPDLRIKLNRIKENAVRVVRIEGHDLSACKGVHVKNLCEIGDFAIIGVRLGKRKEVKFVVGERARNYHFIASQKLREIIWKRNLSIEKLEKYIENIERENSRMRNALIEVSRTQKFNVETCGDLKIYHIFFPYAEYKTAQRKAMEIANHENAVVIYGIGQRNLVCIAFNPEVSWVKEDYIEQLRHEGGRGGGKGNFLSGSVENPAEFIKKLKRVICQKALRLHGDENGYD